MTEKRLANILGVVSKEGYNTSLTPKNREALRATSKGVREGINKVTEHIYPVNETLGSETIPTGFIRELYRAIIEGDRGTIRRMLGKNIIPTSLYRQARIGPALLDTPVRSGSLETLLYYAVEHDDLETVQLLLEKGANPNGAKLAEGVSLAEQGARVLSPDPRAISFPATNRAAYNANLPMLQALVEAGGNINAWGSQGEDPAILVSLECALNLRNRSECGGKYKYDTKLAQKAMADPDLFQKYINIFYYAIDNGGDVNIAGMGARTPIRSAVALALYDAGAIALVEELLNHGADPDVPDSMGWSLYSARDVVEQRGTPELKALLAPVPQGGYPQQPANGAAGGATSGGRRRKRRVSRKPARKHKKQTKRK